MCIHSTFLVHSLYLFLNSCEGNDATPAIWSSDLLTHEYISITKRHLRRCLTVKKVAKYMREGERTSLWTSVPTSTFQKLVVALVHFRLDYGNGVLVGYECSGTADLRSETLRPHHRRTRQPSLAAGLGAHIQYKTAVQLSYYVLYDTSPRYLGPLTRVADIPGRRALRSASTDRLEIPYFKLSTIGGRAFPVSASQI